MKPLRVDCKLSLNRVMQRWIQMIWWPSVVFAALGNLRVTTPYFAAFLLGTFGWACYQLLPFGPLEMDETRIRLYNHRELHEIAWDDVLVVEMTVKDESEIVFRGKNKSLVVAGSDLWNGEDKAAMLALMHRQIKARDITVVYVQSGQGQVSVNTKVTRKVQTLNSA